MFRAIREPPPWEAEVTVPRPVHARLVKRAAEKAKQVGV